jgi:hypothetical protein
VTGSHLEGAAAPPEGAAAPGPPAGTRG